MAASNSPFLFVYGTLLSCFRHEVAQCVSNHWAFKSNACANGQLFSLGDYPGMVLLNDEKSFVFGELYFLKDPQRVFELLDRYEGLQDVTSKIDEYRREIIEVTTNHGKCTAWAYLYNWPLQNAHRVATGDYRTEFEGFF